MKAWKLLLGAGLLTAASQANATVTLYLQADGVNGGAVTQIASDSGSGVLNYAGNYGSFLSTVSGIGSPTVASPTLLTQSINVSSVAAGTLSLYLVQSGLTNLTGSLLSTFTANAFTGNVISVAESTYLGLNNEAYGGVLLGSANFTGIGTSTTTSNIGSLTGPFSETAKYTITVGSGVSTANDTINISAGAVPEPASWAMMLAGFGVAGFAMRRNRRTTTSVRFA